ncbi:MAG: nucleotide exchange factor GrpE [Sphingobium sp.]|nr:nucleotide exchange factor GrpE [Sphingobium sp.]
MSDENKVNESPVAEEITVNEADEAALPNDGASDMETKIAALEQELENAKQDVLYAHADTQNLRRRMEKELADARNYAATSFARDVLSVADNLGRALEAIPADLRDDEKMKGLVTGLEATGRELENIFGRNGIEKVETIGQPLDPNFHQAMMEIPHDGEPGVIVQEIQAGYKIKDRLLRPALVGVSKKPD